ncbi:hypothetical protein MBLNU230_g3466t1 [Neophaeotheca triangularis]
MSSNLPVDTSSPSPLISKLAENRADSTPSRNTPAKPLSGPGASRQSRRLQLRNAGFRGPTMPSRKVTPKASSDITADTLTSHSKDRSPSEETENYAPSASIRVPSGNMALGGLQVGKTRRTSGGILQEIRSPGSLTGRQSIGKKAKPRPSTGNFVVQSPNDPVAPRNDYDAAFTAHETLLSSPPPPTSHKHSIKPKKTKSRARIPNKQRRSVSAEASKYIEALEAELASTQSQLSAVNSPSVTRRQKSAMRSLNAETRQLEVEIAEWEERYDERIQEEADRFAEIEAGLRANIRSLEQQAEEGTYRLQELELELENARDSLESAEQANVHMERRLEIMGELLATSPTKIDFTTPGAVRRNRHQRPKSMMPRFPTAGSLRGSPERIPRTQPTSPDMAFGYRRAPSAAPSAGDNIHQGLSIDTSLPISDLSSDGGSVFSEAPMTGDSMTTAGPDTLSLSRTSSHFEPHAFKKPTRRMRRFHAGSIGPKPLILPATSHYESVPASAPPLEEHHGFAFPPPELLQPVHGQGPEDLSGHSPIVARRRASTEADETTMASLEAAPFLSLPQTHQSTGLGGFEDSSMGPNSAVSQATTRNFSSLGSVLGRNLMEELSKARTNETEDPWSTTGGASSDPDETNMQEEPAALQNTAHSSSTNDALASRPTSSTILPLASSPSTTTATTSKSSTPTHRQTLHQLFANLFRTPLALARHVIQNAQSWGSAFSIPAPLRNVQWWLVGVLLGPMAKRRMLLSRRPTELEGERTPILRSPDSENESSGYGTFPSPTVASSPDPLSGPVTTLPRPRHHHHRRKLSHRSAGCSKSDRSCACDNSGALAKQRERSKHSPWLWLRFSLTLAFAVGAAFTQGPGSLLACPGGIAGGGRILRGRGLSEEADREVEG